MKKVDVKSIGDIKLIIEMSEQGSHMYNGMMHQSRVVAILKDCLAIAEELVRLAEIGQAITEAFDNDCMLQVDDLYWIKHIEALIELKNSGKWKGFKDE